MNNDNDARPFDITKTTSSKFYGGDGVLPMWFAELTDEALIDADASPSFTKQVRELRARYDTRADVFLMWTPLSPEDAQVTIARKRDLRAVEDNVFHAAAELDWRLVLDSSTGSGPHGFFRLS